MEKYNQNVAPKYRLQPHSGALLVLSRSDFFEKTFIPFVRSREYPQNPVDQSVRRVLKENFSNSKIIHSHDFHENGCPKLFMQKGRKNILNQFFDRIFILNLFRAF